MEGKQAFQALGPVGQRRGTVEGATGFGKTKVALDVLKEDYLSLNVVIAVPFTKLRDETWPDEMKLWGVPSEIIGEDDELRPISIKLICHASLHKLKGQTIDLFIMDEGHHLTELMHIVFADNDVRDVLFLTATFPSQDESKYPLIMEVAPSIFKYSIARAIEDRSVADFTVHVMYYPLDDTRKIYEVGSKKKKWFTTERKAYDGYAKMIRRAYAQKKEDYAQLIVHERARFIGNCKSKVEFAKKSIKMMAGRKTLIFCGGIEMSKEIGGDWVYNSKSGNEYFKRFAEGENDYLVVIKAVDEGVNIPLLDDILIVTPSSSSRRMIQRIGRAIRYREGHEARVYIACASGTIEETYLIEALAEIPKEKIKYHDMKSPYLW